MIREERVMPFLNAAYPSFTEKRAAHSAYWENKNSLYVDLAEFASHLIELHKSNQFAEFPAAFEVGERLHPEGDKYVKEVVAVGLLEAMRNNAKHNQISSEEFTRYLQPEPAKRRRQLNNFWKGEITLRSGRRLSEPKNCN